MGDSIVAPRTTADTFDPQTVMDNLTTAVGANAIPSTVTLDELGKVGDALTAAASNNNTPAATTPAVTTPAVTTPAVTTPAVTTPAATTPAATTPSGGVTNNPT